METVPTKKTSIAETTRDAATGKLTVHVLRSASEILASEEPIDAFLKTWSQNPLLLKGFISQFMNSTRTRGWTPLYLIMKDDEKIVGTAPLMTKTQFGFRYAEFLPEDWLAPDFVIDSQFRDAFIHGIFEYLFGRLNCHFVKFNLPLESPNVKPVADRCRAEGDGFSIYNQSSHCAIPVDCGWDEFEGRKGRRRKIRQIERKLDQIAPWEVEYVEDACVGSAVPERVLDIERRSWKESFQNDLRAANVEQLMMALEGSRIVGDGGGDFKCSAWFLNFNRKPAAYTLVVKYKGTAFIVKTSFDKKFAKSYVGKYVNTIAIRDMFHDGQTKTIDFMAAYPFMSFWTPYSAVHVGFSIWKGTAAAFMWRLRQNTFMTNEWNFVFRSSAYMHLKRVFQNKRYLTQTKRILPEKRG